MTGLLAALLGALPELVRGGIDAFQLRRAELSPVVKPMHRQTELEDDEEMRRRDLRDDPNK